MRVDELVAAILLHAPPSTPSTVETVRRLLDCYPQRS